MKKKILSILLAAISVVGLFSFTACTPQEPEPQITGSQGLDYKTYKGETYCVVTGIGDCTDYDVEIPSTYEGLSVVGIEDEAFKNCDNLTSVKVPDGVKTIGANAFEGCTALEKLTLPDSIESVGIEAFKGCDNLTYNIYDGVNYLGNFTNKCVVLIDVLDDTQTTYTINSYTKVIMQSAFWGCEEMIEITIPNGVVEIGQTAFSHCEKLQKLVIPSSVKTIGLQAFSYCEEMIEITIPSSVTSFGKELFTGCKKIATITYTGTMAEWDALKNTEYLGLNAIRPTIQCSDGVYSSGK